MIIDVQSSRVAGSRLPFHLISSCVLGRPIILDFLSVIVSQLAILAISNNFCPITILTGSNLLYKNSSKWTIFGIFNELLITLNVDVARFARNVE